MVKKGEEQVSSQDSPRQGEKRNPDEGKVKHKGKDRDSKSHGNAQSEGSSKG